ncbi:hypothetical protein D3C71_899750 [compost metagenome]
MTVVRFDNLDVRVVTHHFGRFLQQLEHHVHADAEVSRKDNGDVLRRLFDGLLARVVKTGGADDHALTVLTAKGQMVQRPFRAGEIDEYIKIVFHRIQAALHSDARLTHTCQFARIGSQ